MAKYINETFACRVFMASAVWLPFMVGRAARQCLYDCLAILATSEAEEAPAVPKERLRLEGSALIFLNKAVQLLSRNATLVGGRFNEVTEARMASLSPLNRLAARLESALTGLELGDWFCLCLGYGMPSICTVRNMQMLSSWPGRSPSVLVEISPVEEYW